MAFDVKVNAEAKKLAEKEDVQIMTADIIYHLFDKFTKYIEQVKLAEKEDVQIMTADIIYHLFDKFTKYIEQVKEAEKTTRKAEAVFPVALKIQKEMVFRQKDPILVGCKVELG